MKQCPDCKVTKTELEFYPDKRKILSTYCIECTKIRNKKYTEKNRERHKKWCKVSAKNNKEKISERRKQYYLDNKQKISEVQKIWTLSNREKIREAHLKRTYGIDLEYYNNLLTKQDSSCAVCKRHKDEFKKNLAVDHDHKTGEIFGLLCDYCNRRLIGRDRDPEKFLSAHNYLRQGTGFFVPKKKPKRRKKNN